MLPRLLLLPAMLLHSLTSPAPVHAMHVNTCEYMWIDINICQYSVYSSIMRGVVHVCYQ